MKTLIKKQYNNCISDIILKIHNQKAEQSIKWLWLQCLEDCKYFKKIFRKTSYYRPTTLNVQNQWLLEEFDFV